MQYFINTSIASTVSDFGSSLYCWMECNSLFQAINEPTRITYTGSTRLDLIITNSPSYFVSSGTLSPPANCDHCVVYAKLRPGSNVELFMRRT
jgi:hypothetical protein